MRLQMNKSAFFFEFLTFGCYFTVMCYFQEYAYTPDYFNAEWCKQNINLTTREDTIEYQIMKKYEQYYSLADLSDYLNGSKAIKGIGSEFVEDVQLILKKFDNNPFVIRNMMELVSDFICKIFSFSKSQSKKIGEKGV